MFGIQRVFNWILGISKGLAFCPWLNLKLSGYGKFRLWDRIFSIDLKISDFSLDFEDDNGDSEEWLMFQLWVFDLGV